MISESTISPSSIITSAALWAAIVAGAVFMMLEMIMVPVFMRGSPWGSTAHDCRHWHGQKCIAPTGNV